MGREIILKCDFCGKRVETMAGKLYLARVLPGKALTSFMSGYELYADVCTDCLQSQFIPKMKRRQARKTVNGTKTKPKARAKR